MHFVFLNAAAAGDELDDAADIAAHVVDAGGRITTFDITADKFVLAHVDDLKIFRTLEIVFRARRRAIEIILQRLRYLDADE